VKGSVVMSNEYKNNFKNLSSVTNNKQADLSSSCAKCNRGVNSNQKSAGDNEWSSVPITYDKDESMHKNKKSETNNQWTSTSK
jgi:hypothetical protein